MKKKRKREKENENENDEALMSSKDDNDENGNKNEDENKNEDDDETMSQNEIIKEKNDILDNLIDKSKSFEEQIKSLKKRKDLKGLRVKI